MRLVLMIFAVLLVVGLAIGKFKGGGADAGKKAPSPILAALNQSYAGPLCVYEGPFPKVGREVCLQRPRRIAGRLDRRLPSSLKSRRVDGGEALHDEHTDEPRDDQSCRAQCHLRAEPLPPHLDGRRARLWRLWWHRARRDHRRRRDRERHCRRRRGRLPTRARPPRSSRQRPVGEGASRITGNKAT